MFLRLRLCGEIVKNLLERLHEDDEDSLPDSQKGMESSADAPLGHRLACLTVSADGAIQLGYQ